MESIVRVRPAGYDRYEELLLKRDRLRKEELLALKAYIREFGEEERRIFGIRVECIRIRKLMALYQAELNHGRIPDAAYVQGILAQQMADYYSRLEEMAAQNEACRRMTRLPEHTVQKIKRVYRELAKRLHPDLNPLTAQRQDLMELWHRLSAAYRANDLEELEELQVLADRALDGTDAPEIRIDDIEGRIAALEKENEGIVGKDPYLYRLLLSDPQATADKHAELTAAAGELQEALTQLQSMLHKLEERMGNACPLN